jgi:hypothetical protein
MKKIYSSFILLNKRLRLSIIFILFFAGTSYAQTTKAIDQVLLQGKWALAELHAKSIGGGLTAEEIAQIEKAYLYASPLTYTTVSFQGNQFTSIEKGMEIQSNWYLEGNVLVFLVPNPEMPPRKFILRNLDSHTLHLDYLTEDSDGNTYVEFIFAKQP